MSDTNENKFEVINGGKSNSNDTEKQVLKVFHSELKTVEFSNVDELFCGFDTIKAITFSYDIRFINHLMQYFQYGEIILGADFMVQKDGKLNDLLEVAANNYDATQAVKNQKRLVDMLSNGDLNLRAANYILDHRKIYLLKADDGRTRVIKASANMSGRAWNGDQMEYYEYDDSLFCYEEFENDFEVAWINSSEIPYTMVTGKKNDEYINENPVIKKAKETNKVTVVQTTPNPVNIEITKFMIDHKKVKEDYKEIFNGSGAKNRNGIVELKPRVLEKINVGLKKFNAKRKVNISITERNYPSLTFDWNEKKAYMNKKELNLHPTAEDICKDIDEVMKVFKNFEMFVDETNTLQSIHFKFMSFIFQSPFHSKLHCELTARGISAMSAPMFALETSDTANSGKTFMTNFILKMMTGEKNLAGNNENAKLDFLRTIINGGVQGIPYFVDEINGSLPSTVDQNGFRTASNTIINKVGTALYREYLGRMIVAISDLIDMIDECRPQEENDTWYPDIVNISSKILLAIFTENGYDIPSYMKELEWNRDYYGANYIAENTIQAIKKEYKENPDAFVIEREIVKIEAGGADAMKKFKSWENTLPAEMRAKSKQMRDGSCFISMNRKELEDRLGFKLKKHIFPFLKK